MSGKKLKLLGAVALLLALVPWTGQAQQQSDSSQSSIPASSAHIIDGAISPEQIPDKVIFRLWAIHNTRNGTVTDLDGYGLSPGGLITLTAILKEFRTAHDGFVASQDDKDDQVFWGPLLRQTALSYNRLGELSAEDLAGLKKHLAARKAGLRLSDIDYGLESSVRKRNLEERSMVVSAHLHPGMAPQTLDGMTANYSSYTQQIYSGGAQVDTFGRQGSLSSNWVNKIGAFSVNASGYVYQSAGGGSAGRQAWAYYKSASTFTNSCSATRAGTIDNNHMSVNPAVRISPSSETGYYAYFSQNLVVLGDAMNGSYKDLTSASYTSNAGDVLRLCATGTTISVFANKLKLISVTNTDIPGAGYDGMWSSLASTGTARAWTGHTALGVAASGSVTGNTSCSGGVCPIGAFHYGTVTISSAAGGNQTQGNRVLPNAYLNVSDQYTYFDDQLLGNPVSVSMQVNCTIAGLFWTYLPPDHWWISNLESEMAQTTAANIGPVPGEPGNWYLASHCYPTPPDMDVDGGKQKNEPAADPAWDDMGECNRVQVFGVYTPWGCPIPGVAGLVYGVPLYTYVTEPALQICTIWSQGLIEPNGPGFPLIGTPPN